MVLLSLYYNIPSPSVNAATQLVQDPNYSYVSWEGEPQVIFPRTSPISYAFRKISIRTFEKQDKLCLFKTTNFNFINFHFFAGYEGQNDSQNGSAIGGGRTSSLDCLSLIVESISPGLLQGQGRSSVRLHATSKHEEIGDNVDHTAPVVKMTQQWQPVVIWTCVGYKLNLLVSDAGIA